MNSQITKNDASLESGKSYGFMGCNWTVCEFVNDGMTAVLQSHGVTEGPWPGFIMPQFGMVITMERILMGRILAVTIKKWLHCMIPLKM